MAMAVLGSLLALAMPGHTSAEEATASAADPQISIHDGFVDENRCASCHADQAAAFAKSNHAKAMAVADDSTVRANFDGLRFEHDGILTTFFKRGGRYFVRTEGPDGKEGEFQVKYTFAYEPLQQYLVDIGGGRLQALDIAWDTTKRAWFWLGTGKPAKPGTTYHWTGPFYRWNRTCIDCHSTDPQANFQPETGEYQSTYVATSIGCQSCHGGGAKHVEWAEAGTVLSRSPISAWRRSTRMCAWAAIRDGRSFSAATGQERPFSIISRRPAAAGPLLSQTGKSWTRCSSTARSSRARWQEPASCASTATISTKRPSRSRATPSAPNAMPRQSRSDLPTSTRAADFDTPAHTHHPAGSAGALCANCHMPERTYMKVDPRRDHSFVIPRPDLSIAYGTPNACTTCHATQTNAWAAETMDKWYGPAWRKRPTIAHAFAGAAQNDPAAIEALRALVADREQSGIVKGSAIAEMGRLGGDAVFADVRTAAENSDPLVRLGAAQAAAIFRLN